MQTRHGRLAVPLATAGCALLMSLSPGASASTPGGGYQPLPALPVNSCDSTSLPQSFGTNFPTPADPYGFGYANQSIIGWEGNWYAPFAYLSGAYFARGVPVTYAADGQSYCGGMYSFSVYDYGLPSGRQPPAGSVLWTEADGYLPALTTSFTRDHVHVSITDFANKQAIDGNPVELVYTRISVTNEGAATVSVPPGQSGPDLVELDSAPDTVAPGRTADHYFVAAVDTFGSGKALPSIAQVTAGALSYQAAYRHMADYWNSRLSVAPKLTLPNTRLPDTANLADPGTTIDNAYRAAYVYTRIVQSGEAPFSGANNYDWLLNHDLPGILDNKFALGDFSGARNLLLAGRISESPAFNEEGANWYWDGPWRTPLAWAEYLLMTNDTSFVRRYFDDDDAQWGPSLVTMMHTDYLSQLNSATGYLGASNDNDSYGTWLFDDETALAGLAAYRYIAARIGDTSEASWANGAYDSLLSAVNAGLSANEKANGFDYLPCEVNEPFGSDRCATSDDANWAGSDLWGQDVWSIFLEGGALDGVLGDPSQTDNLYETGFSRLDGTGVPFPSFGAYDGYSVALNTAYTNGALYGSSYRSLPITSYAWQIASTTGGPNAWWEANGSAPSPGNPWAGSHAAPEFGAIPYAWPMAGQTQTLLQSLVAQGLVASGTGTTASDYSSALYVGRGIPDQWVTPGQTVAVGNLTSSYDVGTGHRSTYSVCIHTTRDGSGHSVVTVSFGGRLPSSDVRVQLPAFADEGVLAVGGGSYSAPDHTVRLSPGSTAVRVVLGDSAKPVLSVTAASTAGGTHDQPMLSDGTPARVTSTFTNKGGSTLRSVGVDLSVPSGWAVQPTSPDGFASVAPGRTETATWLVTPASGADGGFGLRVTAGYSAPASASGSAGAEQWTRAQPALPVPAGLSDVALTGTASASYTSPWTQVSAVNDGLYPPESHDTADPYWGTWPEQGTQWLQLDWDSPQTVSGASVYFWSDGSGVMPPRSWVIQYWNGSSWVNVGDPSGYGTTLNGFNTLTFTAVSTTELRATFDTGYTGTCTGACNAVGVLQWVVDGTS